MPFPRMLRLSAMIVAITGLSCLAAAHAQTFPDKPIKFIVPFPPGGGSDVVSRLMAREMSSRLGQAIVIENVSGAAGAVGLAALSRSAPDGYTIGWGGLGPTVLVHIIGPKPQYNRDQLVAFARTGAFHYVVIGRPGLPHTSLREVIAAAKQKPDATTFATSGVGGPVHLSLQFLRNSEKVSLREVPFKGDPESLLEVVADRIDLGVISVPAALEQVRAGKVKALAVPTDKRLPFLPTVPTTAESGAPGLIAEAVGLLMAPAQTPRPVLERLNGEANAALQNPDVLKQFADLGLVADPLSLDEALKVIDRLTERWSKVIAEAKIPVVQ